MSPCRVSGYLKVGFLALFLTLLPLLALGGGDEGNKPGKPERVPFSGPVPKANCGHGDHTESGLQGETTQEERFSGDSERAYNCNLELVGQEPQDEFEGAFSQDGPAYAGNCAYYGTDRVTSLQQHLGVRVIDASDPGIRG